MRLPALLLLLVTATASARGHDESPQILLFPSLGRPLSVRVSGRVLKEALEPKSSALAANLSQLKARNLVGAAVEVEFEGVRAETITGRDGQFEVTLGAPTGAPFRLGFHPLAAKVKGAATDSVVEIVADEAPFLVVSDFDDTVAITNVTSTRGLLKASLLQDGTTQPAVEGMAGFYRCLLEGKARPPGLAFVSGSPVQFAPRILTFLDKHEFPPPALYLRNLGMGTLSGYKQPIIRRLLDQFPQPAVLIGDSGEHDPEVYGDIRREYPGRVARIYIRDAGLSADPKRFDGMFLFKSPIEAAGDAVEKGFASRACIDAAFAAPATGR